VAGGIKLKNDEWRHQGVQPSAKIRRKGHGQTVWAMPSAGVVTLLFTAHTHRAQNNRAYVNEKMRNIQVKQQLASKKRASRQVFR